MNQEDIIKMAREAEGFAVGYYKPSKEFVLFAERFAALVAAAEREYALQTIEELMGSQRERNNMFSEGYDYALESLEQFIKGRST